MSDHPHAILIRLLDAIRARRADLLSGVADGMAAPKVADLLPPRPIDRAVWLATAIELTLSTA